MTPPRLPRRLLHAIAPPEYRAAIIGDLDEEYRAHPGSRRVAAACYWTQAIRSLPFALRLRWRRAAPLRDTTGDLRWAWRLLWRRPAFTAAAVTTLALGAGITTAVGSIAEAILLRPLPYANADRIVSIRERDRTRQGATMSWADYVELSGNLRTLSAIAGYSGASRTLTGAGQAERLPAIEVTAGFFDVLGVAPALGRAFTAEDTINGAAPVVLLSDTTWRRRFAADPAAVGRTIRLSGVPFTIVGVLPASFVFPPRADPELWLPLRPSPAQVDRPYLHFMDIIGVRARGSGPARIDEELRVQSVTWQQSGKEWHAGTSLHAVGLRDDMVAGVRPALLVLLGAALLVLLVSAANVSGLLLARAATRSGEMNVRAALGAGRWRTVRQLLVEALSIAIPGAAAGVAIGWWAIAYFAASTPIRFRATLPFADQLMVSPRAAVISTCVTILAVLAAGMLPALAATHVSAIGSSGGRTTNPRPQARLRGFFVAAQVALAVVLLTGAVLIARSVLNLSRVSPGFSLDGLLAGRVSLPDTDRYRAREAVATTVDRILERVRGMPGVVGAEAINQLPLTGRSNTGGFSVLGRATTVSVDSLIRDFTPGYFSLLGIPLSEGRALQAGDTRDAPRVVVINRTLARAVFSGASPIGERIVFEFFTGRPAWTIVGVVGDEQFDSLDKPMAPVVYFPFAQDPEPAFSVVVRATAPEAMVASLRAAVAAVDPDLPVYGVQTLASAAAASNAVFLRTLVMRLLAWFSAAALLLGGVGIYGVLAEFVTARTKEIGLRQALGATRAEVAGFAMRSALIPAACGALGGMALAVILAPAARSLLFGIAALDLSSLAIVCLVVALAACVACIVPARRAMNLPPASALRQE